MSAYDMSSDDMSSTDRLSPRKEVVGVQIGSGLQVRAATFDRHCQPFVEVHADAGQKRVGARVNDERHAAAFGRCACSLNAPHVQRLAGEGVPRDSFLERSLV
jgi:hypothetical protein